MKRLGCAALAMLLMFSMGACASETGDDKNGETQEEEKKDVYAMKETVHLEDMDVTVNSVSTSTGEDYIKPADGKVFVLINITITNTSDDTISYNELYANIQNKQGQIESVGLSMYSPDDKINSGKLATGGSITGSIVTEAAESEINSMIFIYEPNPFSDEAAKVQLAI